MQNFFGDMSLTTRIQGGRVASSFPKHIHVKKISVQLGLKALFTLIDGRYLLYGGCSEAFHWDPIGLVCVQDQHTN